MAKFTKKPFEITLNVKLSELLAQAGGEFEAAIRPAAFAAASMVYEEAKANMSPIGVMKGNLESSLYRKFMPDLSNEHKSVYKVSWNARKAPHAMWFEYGWTQRYVSYIGRDGKWHTKVQPQNVGKEPPWVYFDKNGTKRNRRKTREQTDAWYVARKEPIQHRPVAFMRRTADKVDEAAKRATEVVLARLKTLEFWGS